MTTLQEDSISLTNEEKKSLKNRYYYTSAVFVFVFALFCIFLSLYFMEKYDHEYHHDKFAANYTHLYEWAINYPNCGGDYQSPVDIVTASTTSGAQTITFGLTTGSTVVYQVNASNVSVIDCYENCPSITLDGIEYVNESISFHIMGEHTIDGALAQAEFEMLCMSSGGSYLSYSQLVDFEGSSTSASIDKIFDTARGEYFTGFTFADLFATSGNYYVYNGSLTYPPCTEGVMRIVDAQVQSLDMSYIDSMRTVVMNIYDTVGWMPGNYRPTQELNGRPVYSV